METLPDATREMVRFIAEMNAENNERSNKRTTIIKKLQKKRDKIVEALIGIGNGLKILTEKLADAEEDLVSQEKELAYQDTNSAFLRKFGITMYSVNQNLKFSQKEIDSIKGEED